MTHSGKCHALLFTHKVPFVVEIFFSNTDIFTAVPLGLVIRLPVSLCCLSLWLIVGDQRSKTESKYCSIGQIELIETAVDQLCTFL